MTESTPITEAKWTIMIYMAGDNNLSADMLLALKELQIMDRSKEVNVVVQYDPNADDIPTERFIFRDANKSNSLWHSFDGNVELKEPQSKEINAESASTASVSSIDSRKEYVDIRKPYFEKKFLDTDSGSLWTLYDFMKWSFAKCPAEKYMLIISGHSSGLENGFLATDEDSGDALSIPELEYALYLALNPSVGEKNKTAKNPSARGSSDENDRGKLAILGFDSCLMSSIEVGYELRRHTDLMIASEGFVANAGWCYRKMFNELVANPTMSPKEFSNSIVDTFLLHYLDYVATGISVDIAVSDLSKCDNIKTHINALADTLISKLDSDDSIKNPILLAHWEAQTYKNDLYVDIYDLCLMLEKYLPNDTEIAEKCKALKDAIRDESETSYIFRSAYIGPTFQNSYGVTIHFPWAKLLPDYIGKSEGKIVKQPAILGLNQNKGLSDTDETITPLDSSKPRIAVKQQFDFLRGNNNEKTKWREFVELFVRKTQRKAREGAEWKYLPESFKSMGDWIIHNTPDALGNSRVTGETGHPRIGGTGHPKGAGLMIGSMKNPSKEWNLEVSLKDLIVKTFPETKKDVTDESPQ